MSGTDEAVLDFLREQFARVNGELDALRLDGQEMRERMGRVERSVADLGVQMAEHSDPIRSGQRAP